MTTLPSYVIYAIPVILIVAIAAFFLLRKKQAKKENVAVIYSVLKHDILCTRTFTLNQDKTQAYLVPDVKPGFSLDSLRPKSKEPTTEPIAFNPSLAVYNVKAGGYFTIFAHENNTQLPLISGNTEYLAKITALGRNVDRRITRLNASQQAIMEYVNASSPAPKFGQLELLNLVLIFIAFLALAYAVSSLTSNITALGTLLKGIHAFAANTIP